MTCFKHAPLLADLLRSSKCVIVARDVCHHRLFVRLSHVNQVCNHGGGLSIVPYTRQPKTPQLTFWIQHARYIQVLLRHIEGQVQIVDRIILLNGRSKSDCRSIIIAVLTLDSLS